MSERTYWTRQGSRGLSRRTLLGVSARTGVGAVGLALVGCGDDDRMMLLQALSPGE
jgi:hypothetical protein